MSRVGITAAAVAHPETRVSQADAAKRIAAAVGQARRVHAIARGTHIDSRAICLPPEELAGLRSVGQRNAVYERLAPRLAMDALGGLDFHPQSVSMVVTSSCTGYMIPGIDVHIARELGLSSATARLPITEAGCAGGVVAIARAFDYLRLHPCASALVVATELCSLAFHAEREEGNLVSALLFADGAGAALLTSDFEPGNGLELHGSASMLVPCPPEVLGFRLTDQGFYPLLSRDLVDRLPEPTVEAVSRLLSLSGIATRDVAFWLIHPGGPRVLEALQRRLCIPYEAARWSWQTLRESGNTSSAAILEVLARYLSDPCAPSGWGVVMAFGPGLSIELLLVRRC